MNKRSPVTGGSRWYSWVVVVFPVGYKGSGIPVLKYFILYPVIRICGLPLSKYLSFTSLVNSACLNIVDVVVSDTIPCTGLLGPIFLNCLGDVFNIRNHVFGILIDVGCVPGPVTLLMFPYIEAGIYLGYVYLEMISNIPGFNEGFKCGLLILG